MENLLCFGYVMIALFLGEWISTRTQSWVPSLLISAIIFLIGFWTVIPKDLVTKASFGPEFVAVGVSLLLVHLGTLMSFKRLIQQWRAICIALIGVAGTMILTMTIAIHFFGRAIVIGTVPTLTGGIISALLMTQGLTKAGLTTVAAYPVAMFVVHEIISFPLISAMLKNEGRRLQKVYAANPEKMNKQTKQDQGSGANKRQHFFTPGGAYETSAFVLAKVGVVAIFSNWLASLTHGTINSAVFCLVCGVIAHELGFLPDDALNKAGVFHWLMYGLLAYILGQLGSSSPQEILRILGGIIVIIILGLLGMFITSYLLAKPFGFSHSMAFACALTALCGFPADYVLTTEVTNSLTDNEQERQYLLDNMLPKMLVGGFATVSVASVIIASVFLRML